MDRPLWPSPYHSSVHEWHCCAPESGVWQFYVTCFVLGVVGNEKDAKTVQGLLRHADVSTTLGLYAQSVNSSMVEAQESMLTAILRNGSDTVD
jgi:hypothetical protein